MPGGNSRGVASETMERPLKGLSTKQILALTVTNGCQGVMLTMPFTVAVYMVRSFLQKANSSSGTLLLRESNTAATVDSDGFADVDEQLVGQLTGTLAAVYSFSQFTTSYAWGLVSNKIGRKPIMILGTLVSTAGLIWFGLAGNFASAAAARGLAGLLNGIIVAWKCMLGESCDSLTQGRVMSYMSLAWGVGCIAGPTIGGMLSQPCNTWPEMTGCHGDGFLRLRPYFLPCAVAAALSAISLVFNIIFLEETLPAILARRSSRRQQRQQYTLLPAAAAAAAKEEEEVQLSEQQDSRMYRRVMSNSVSPYVAKIMQDRVANGGSSSSRAELTAAAAAVDYAESSESHDSHDSDSDLGPFVSVQVDNLDASSSSSSGDHGSSSNAEVPGNPRFLSRAASARSLQLRSDPSDRDLSKHNTCHIAAASSSSSEEGVVQVTKDHKHDFDSDLADVIKADDYLVNSSSRSSKWPSLLHWDSAWQLFNKDSSSSSRAVKYNKLQQLQQQQQQQQDRKQAPHLADVMKANNSLISSSSSSKWPSLLRWDSAWQLLNRDSSSSNSRLMKYSKIQQQQEQEQQDLDQPDMIVEMGSLAIKDQDLGYAAAAAALSNSTLLTAPNTERQQQQQQQHDADLSDLSPRSTSTGAAAAAAAAAPWYKQRSVVLSLLGYGNTCLLFCALDELTPMFASAPLKQGGLSLHEVQLAGPLAFNGVCLMFISLLAYPPLQRALGTLPLTRIGLVLAVITALLTPATRFAVTADSSSSSTLITPVPQHAAVTKGLSSSSSHSTIGRKLLGADVDQYTDLNPTNISHTAAAAGSSSSTDIGPAAWAILYISMLLKSASSCPAFTGSMILVNSLPSPEHLGQVNGVGQSLASLARGIGPAMGGVLWGATVKVAVPGAQMLPYVFVALSAAAGWVLYNFVEMPDGKEVRRQQQQQGSSCCQE